MAYLCLKSLFLRIAEEKRTEIREIRKGRESKTAEAHKSCQESEEKKTGVHNINHIDGK